MPFCIVGVCCLGGTEKVSQYDLIFLCQNAIIRYYGILLHGNSGGFRRSVTFLKSMTGYGRATARTERYEITAEVHSVNHRFLETSVRLPRSFSYLEEKLKEQVQQKISRGKVEVTLTMQTIGAKSTVVEINHDVVTAYLQAIAAENALLRESGFRRNQIMLGTAAD